MSPQYDALLVIAFGGPERHEDVLPFLENVTRGRNVPRERLLKVAEHYYHFEGKSPINDQVRALIGALKAELARREIELPIFWGNRNWQPLLADTMAAMGQAGIRRALGLVQAAYSSYSSCRQYLENITRAQAAAGPTAPAVDKIRAFYNHPSFIDTNADNLRQAIERLPHERQKMAHVAFTAHSIPVSMARGCRYEEQLNETCRLVCERIGVPAGRWALVYQSRSGRPSDPWLGPNICEHLATLPSGGVRDVVVMPIGFLSDHLEVLYDLDVEAQAKSREIGLNMIRASTVGTHPAFVAMWADLVQERLDRSIPRASIGRFGPEADQCAPDCCPPQQRPKMG